MKSPGKRSASFFASIIIALVGLRGNEQAPLRVSQEI
jgi:hypothetical protein